MANLERMTVVFPEPMAAQIRAAVEAGEYASTSEAVRDAVRLWSGRRHIQDLELSRLQHAWDSGKASGIYGKMDFGELRDEGRRRLTKAKTDGGRAG